MAGRHDVRSLQVFLHGSLVGTLSISDFGTLAFAYSDDAGTVLSVSMPRGNAYEGPFVRAWFDGILPDSMQTRMGMARGKPYAHGSTFGLLSDYGLELPGAVQITRPGEEAQIPAGGSYKEADREEIGRRLANMAGMSARTGGARWHTRGERWSLAGAQPKVALMKRDGVYFECDGAAASNVIVKPGVSKMEAQAEMEHVCMSIARAIGLPCAFTSFEQFGDSWAVVVQRYDREFAQDGSIVRFHQEDFCQALGIPPEGKYLDRDNPAVRGFDLLQTVASRRDLAQFVDSLLFNYLIGAPDAHLKNYSLLHDASGTFSMAPLYDVASGLPYFHDRETQHVAMPIGYERRIGRVGKRALGDMAKAFQIDVNVLVERFQAMAQRILDAAPGVVDALPDIRDSERIAEVFLPRLQLHCTLAVDNLGEGRFRRSNYFAASWGETLDDGNPERAAEAEQRMRNLQNDRDANSPAAARERRAEGASDLGIDRIWVGPYKRNGRDMPGYWRKPPERRA